jgi:lipopolysaccharide export system protein LptA
MMPDRLTTRFPVYLLLAVLLLPAQAYQTATAQSRVQILQAEQLDGFTGNLGPGRKLSGNVHLRIDDSYIEADSVFQYLDLDEIRAFGNIQVTTARETIWADSAIYNYLVDESLFRSRVVIVTENVTIFSPLAHYNFNTETARFPGIVRLEDERGILQAESGVYYSERDSAIFRGNVQFADSTQYVEADSMFSNRVSEYYELYGRVFMHDTENRTKLTGDYAERDSLGRRLIRGNAHLQRINEEATDSTFMWADLIEVTEMDTTWITSARGDVKIWSTNYSTLSDSSSYIEYLEEFYLIGGANIWYDDTQLTGQHILISLVDDTIDRIDSTGEPFAVFQDTLTGRLNQLRGDSIAVLFREGELYRISGRPDARVFYHMKNRDKEPDGGIELRGESAELFFEGGELVDFKAYVNIDGTVHPESDQVLGMRIEGFVWTPESKPLQPVSGPAQRLAPVSGERPFSFPDRYMLYLSRTGSGLQ